MGEGEDGGEEGGVQNLLWARDIKEERGEFHRLRKRRQYAITCIYLQGKFLSMAFTCTDVGFENMERIAYYIDYGYLLEVGGHEEPDCFGGGTDVKSFNFL